MGSCSGSVSLVERAEAAGPEDSPGSPAVLETDCSCCLRHMTSYHLKPWETVSLRREWRGCGRRKRGVKTGALYLTKTMACYCICASLPPCVCLSGLCTSLQSQAFITCIYRCRASGFLPTIQTYSNVPKNCQTKVSQNCHHRP